MSLNYKLPQPVGRFFTEEGMRPEYESIILTTMATGIGKLATDADAVEHYSRARLLAKLEGQDEWFSIAAAREMVGLTTNVFPRETERAWAARIVKAELDRTRRRAVR